jgi:hypothetical protein
MVNSRSIESAAARIRAAIHNAAKIDFEILSLPGGSLIAIVLWLYTSAMSFIGRTAARSTTSGRLTAPTGACTGCDP